MKKTIQLLAAAISVTILSTQPLAAQKEDIQRALEDIYKRYDSSHFLSFDVNYVYWSDTILGNSVNEQMAGTYTMSGRKALFRLGEIEYMQNEHLFVGVYHKDEMIVIAKAAEGAGGGRHLPMRATLDSLLTKFSSQYSMYIGIDSTDTTQRNIVFIATDSLAAYNKLEINYGNNTKYINYIEYSFSTPVESVRPAEGVAIDSVTLETLVIENHQSTRRLRINFENYRIANYDDKLYSHNNYIWFEDGEWKPVERYKNFKVFNTIVE